MNTIPNIDAPLQSQRRQVVPRLATHHSRVHLQTWIFDCRLGMNDCMSADIFSFCSRTVRVLFGPLHRHLGAISRTVPFLGRRVVTKLSCVNDWCVRAVYRTTKRNSNMSKPEHNQLTRSRLSPGNGWSRGPQLSFLTDPQFETVLNCPLLGIPVTVKSSKCSDAAALVARCTISIRRLFHSLPWCRDRYLDFGFIVVTSYLCFFDLLYAVGLSAWFSLKYLITGTMNFARAPGLPREAEERQP